MWKHGSGSEATDGSRCREHVQPQNVEHDDDDTDDDVGFDIQGIQTFFPFSTYCRRISVKWLP